MANKRPDKHQSRLNQARQLPIKKVNVFLWDWSNEAPQELVCKKVNRQEGEDIISSYLSLCLIYDSHSNVWDACEYFGVPDDDLVDDVDDDVLMFDPPSPSGVTPSSDATPSHVLCPSVVIDDKGTSECFEHEAFFQDQPHKLSVS